MWNLIVSVPDHCLSFYLENQSEEIKISNPSNAEIPKSLNSTNKTVSANKHSVSELVGQSETLIPDDVMEEAVSIMRTHSPELAPYIGKAYTCSVSSLNKF